MKRIEYLFIRLLKALFTHISFNFARRIAHVLVFLIERIIKYRYNVIKSNLQRVYGQNLPRPLDELIHDIYVHFIYLWCEMLQFDKINKENYQNYASIEGLSVYNEALKQGKGVVLISGHLANFEWMPNILPFLGIKLTAIVKPIRNKLINDFMLKTRARYGTKIVYPRDAMKEGLKALKRKEGLGLIADQDARKNGIFVEFLGQPSKTAVGPAVFALRTGAPMVLISCERVAYAKMRYTFEAVKMDMEKDDSEDSVKNLTQLHASALEKWIYKNPEQWFWVHKRWKSTPG